MRHRLFDKGLWAVVLSALLLMTSASLLFCPTAQANGPAPPPGHTASEASKTALTLQSDDDGDELLEHWSDPKYITEERGQTAGIAVLLVCAAGAAGRRRRVLRGMRRHG